MTEAMSQQQNVVFPIRFYQMVIVSLKFHVQVAQPVQNG
jgi:hypothetical protein